MRTRSLYLATAATTEAAVFKIGEDCRLVQVDQACFINASTTAGGTIYSQVGLISTIYNDNVETETVFARINAFVGWVTGVDNQGPTVSSINKITPCLIDLRRGQSIICVQSATGNTTVVCSYLLTFI